MSPGRIEGRTVVVTGASSGTGAQAARQLADRGARVVVVGRDRARTDRVAKDLGAPRYLAEHVDCALREVPRTASIDQQNHPIDPCSCAQRLVQDQVQQHAGIRVGGV